MNRVLQKVKQDAQSLVPKTITPLNRPFSSHKGTKDTYPLTHQGESTPSSENIYMSCMRVIWNSPTARGISGNAFSVILQSWRGSTQPFTHQLYLPQEKAFVLRFEGLESMQSHSLVVPRPYDRP